ncbi:SusC/RagA family TonB-linked outer membrane protein [Ilyomonas limi]|uniref:SusC/RagA family TonB-linked outer membrane protein n=1 Tax=Ilyomonas limi TaxID=2575867 RepID=A0A4U3LAX9_9BACT|nr:SusC/RagA family TonB-linked outer membrane protein [Ilyomonas limi]TKK71879.1 SusC/RagA family TonB-linked outer membrane protein [Ilyomonas limi]
MRTSQKYLKLFPKGLPTVIAVVSCLLLIMPAKAHAEQKKKIGLNNATFETVIKEIEKVFSVNFTYDAAMKQLQQKVSLQQKERTLAEVLSELAKQVNVKFIRAGNLIGIQEKTALYQLSAYESPAVAGAPPFLLKGRIIDEKKNIAVANATIHVKDSKTYTTSDEDGNFSIEVLQGDVLEITSVGYAAKEVTIGNSNEIIINLSSSENQLNEVVVTALGIKKERAKINYATQEVKGESLQKAKEANVISSLTGKVAGLTVVNKSTLYENQDVRVRGEATLVVIDGVPTNTNFWNINADDIESVTVLKGTAAAALYGSLGVNGAIMITTKKGKGGSNGLEVSFSSTNQFQAGYIAIPKTQQEYGMGWSGYYAYIDGQGGGGWYDNYGYVWGPKLNVKDPNTASGYAEYPQYNSPYNPDSLYTFTQAGYTGQSHYKPMPWVSRGTNNLKNFLRNEFLTTDNISVAGKTDRTDYRISASHVYQKGQVPNTHLNSTTLTVAGGLKISDKLRAEATISYNKQYTPNYPSSGYGPSNFFYNILLWMGPDVDIRDMKNYWQPGKEGIQQLTYNYSWYNNPYFMANEYLNSYNTDVITAQANATYSFSKNLNLLVRTGATVNNVSEDTKTPYSFINYGTSKAPFGQYAIDRRGTVRIVSDALLTYQNKFGDFDVTVSAGASSRFDQANGLYSNTVGGLAVPNNYTLANTRDPLNSTNYLNEKQYMSLFGYSDISYKNIVYLSLTGRNDWTTALQKPNNSFFYPSAGLGLMVSQLVKLPSAISWLKLRSAWANVSSDVNPYYTLQTYNRGIRWNGVPSLDVPSTLINPDIRPQTTISQEYGGEIKFLKNRIGLDVTYYRYLNKNFVVDVPLSQASGYSYRRVNADEILKKGIEIVLSGTAIKTKNFQWNIVANYSRIRNTAKSYYGGDSIRNGVKIGERNDVYRGYAWERSPDGRQVFSNGLPQYINQIVNLGYLNPDWEFGIINSISYKNFSLSFTFDGQIGGYMFNGVEAKMYEGGMHPVTANHYRDEAYNGEKTYLVPGVVVTEGEVTYDQQGNITSDTRKFAANETNVNYIDYIFAQYTNGVDESVLYKRTFVKLREVVFSYNIPATLFKKAPFKAASIALTGRNLALFTKVPFMDPESYTGTTLAEPTYRNIGVSVNFTF